MHKDVLMVRDTARPARTRSEIIHSVLFLNGDFQFPLSTELPVLRLYEVSS